MRPSRGSAKPSRSRKRRRPGKQPQNFKDKATDEKLVEIGPDVTDAPIKGIDPAENGRKNH